MSDAMKSPDNNSIVLRVRFYDFGTIPLRWSISPLNWLWHGYLALKPNRFRHCSIAIPEFELVFDCTVRRGCHLRLPEWDERECDESVDVEVSRCDVELHRLGAPFTPIKTFFHSTGFIGGDKVINCATSSARMLGIYDRVRTPDDLYRVLKDENYVGTSRPIRNIQTEGGETVFATA